MTQPSLGITRTFLLRQGDRKTQVIEYSNIHSQRETLAIVMLELLEFEGCDNIRIAAPVMGFPMPERVPGKTEDHIPDLTCTHPMAPKKTIYVDVVFSESRVPLEEVVSRMQLFGSAAYISGGEYHIVVPNRIIDGYTSEALVQQLLAKVGVKPHRIWVV